MSAKERPTSFVGKKSSPRSKNRYVHVALLAIFVGTGALVQRIFAESSSTREIARSGLNFKKPPLTIADSPLTHQQKISKRLKQWLTFVERRNSEVKTETSSPATNGIRVYVPTEEEVLAIIRNHRNLQVEFEALHKEE